MTSKVWVAVVSIILIAGLFYYMASTNQKNNVAAITNFEECKNAGYPIMEKYPEECMTSDGRSFVNESQVRPPLE